MAVDLHIHTKTCSDGNLPLEDVFKQAAIRNIKFISITDHDSIDCQKDAINLANQYYMSYLTGVELNVTFMYPPTQQKISLDFLGYKYDINNKELIEKLQQLKDYRRIRGQKILDNLNIELKNEGHNPLSEQELEYIQNSVDGTFGRPHIAAYLKEKGIVRNIQEAFDKYLDKCNIPKYPLSLKDASRLIRNAGGVLVHAHPNDPHGTSLVAITKDLEEQTRIIRTYMLEYIDGIECWHSRHTIETTKHYIKFCSENSLIMTGGSDCHQRPIIMGCIDIPEWIAQQFLRHK